MIWGISHETAIVAVEAMQVKILVQKTISGVGLGGRSGLRIYPTS